MMSLFLRYTSHTPTVTVIYVQKVMSKNGAYHNYIVLGLSIKKYAGGGVGWRGGG